MASNPHLAQSSYESDELKIFRESARKFFENECKPHLARWDEQGHVDRELWHKAGAQGFLCASIPEEYGGGGGHFGYEKVLIEEQGRALCSSFGASLHSGIVAHYILAYGTEEQKRRWLPKMATGELVGAIAMTEPGTGSDLQAVATVAKPEADGYLLEGQKTFITNGQPPFGPLGQGDRVRRCGVMVRMAGDFGANTVCRDYGPGKGSPSSR